MGRDSFLRYFEKKVGRTMRSNKLLENDDKVCVALSGGKDSLVLLSVLKKLSERAPKSGLFAITIDEGAGKYKTETLKAARELCERLDVEHYVFSFKEEFGTTLDKIAASLRKKPENPEPCSYCGVLRRYLINVKARELGATKVATGHILDDEIQSAMMNFTRGDYMRMARLGAYVGVIGDDTIVPRIKPLRDCVGKDVKTYAKIKELPVNLPGCPYSANSFRTSVHEVIERLEDRHPGSKYQLLRSADVLIKLLRESMDDCRTIKKCRICGELSSGEVCKVCLIKKELSIKD